MAGDPKPHTAKILVFDLKGGPHGPHRVRSDQRDNSHRVAHSLWNMTMGGTIGRRFDWYEADAQCRYQVIDKDDAENEVIVTCEFLGSRPIAQGTQGLAVGKKLISQRSGTFKSNAPGDPKRAHKAQSEARSTVAHGGSETVLFVDDEESLRELAHAELESRGYKILEASHGSEALTVCDQYKDAIQLLVTDVVMPEMSGTELAERLAARYPGIKVLYISGYMADEVVGHGLLAVEAPFLQKPYTPATLARKVREVLDSPTSGSRTY